MYALRACMPSSSLTYKRSFFHSCALSVYLSALPHTNAQARIHRSMRASTSLADLHVLSVFRDSDPDADDLIGKFSVSIQQIIKDKKVQINFLSVSFKVTR